jgi:tRNA C32,U32 (ribose-2'-O)-methylase TrmJ
VGDTLLDETQASQPKNLLENGMYKLAKPIPDDKREQYQQLLTNLIEMRSLEQENIRVLNKMISAIENQLGEMK